MDPEQELIRDFEACQVAASSFHHADHIRLVWSYLRTCRHDEAERRLREGLQRLTAHAGASGKYHETMTIAWTRLAAWAVAVSRRARASDDFARRHGWLLEKDAILEFYSRERLMSDEARAQWVEPDLQPLPFPASRLGARRSEEDAVRSSLSCP